MWRIFLVTLCCTLWAFTAIRSSVDDSQGFFDILPPAIGCRIFEVTTQVTDIPVRGRVSWPLPETESLTLRNSQIGKIGLQLYPWFQLQPGALVWGHQPRDPNLETLKPREPIMGGPWDSMLWASAPWGSSLTNFQYLAFWRAVNKFSSGLAQNH